MLSLEEQLTAGNAIFLASELEAIIARFREARIEAILLKGLSLSETLYEHYGKRGMADIDLLVRPADLAKACAALARVGYRRNPGNSGYAWVKKGAINASVD